MKQLELIEGPDAFDRFRAAVKAALMVPKSAILEQEHRAKAEKAKAKAAKETAN